MGQKLLRLAAVRIVTGYDFIQDRFRPGVIALRDTRFSQHGAAFANAFRRIVVRSPGDDCVGQIANGSFKFLVRDGVILRTHGGLAPAKRGFARRYASLSPLHFAIGNAVGVLRERGGAGEERRPKGGGYSCSRFAVPAKRAKASTQRRYASAAMILRSGWFS